MMFGMIGIVVFIFLSFGFMNSIGTTYNMTASEDFQSLYDSSEMAFGDLNTTLGDTEDAFENTNAITQSISFVTENTILAGKTLFGGIGLVRAFFVSLAGIFGLPTFIINAITLIIALIGMIALFRLFSGGVRP